MAAKNLLQFEFVPMQTEFAHVAAIFFAGFMVFISYYQLRAWQAEPQRLAETGVQRHVLWVLLGLAFVSLFSLLLSQLGLEQFALVLAVAVGTSFALLNLTSAFIYFLSLLLLRPWEMGAKDDLLLLLPRASAFIVLTLFFIDLIRERPMRIFWSRECTVLALFAGWLYFTSTQSLTPAEAQDYYWDNMARAVVVFFMTVNILRDKRDLAVYRTVLVGVSFAVACLAIYYSQYLGHKDATERLKYVGLLGDPNDISAFLLLALPFALKPFFKSAAKTTRRISELIFPMIFVLVLLTLVYLAQSRGAIVGLLAFGACVLIDRSRNKKRAVILAMVLGLAYLPMQLVLHRAEGDLQQSGQSRITYWKTGIKMALRHPIFGVGFNDFPAQYQNYLTEPIADEVGHRTAHSSWVLVLAENGFPGFFLFVSLYIFCLKRALRIREEYPEYLYSLVTYGVAMSFLSHTYLLFPYLIFSFVIISECVLRSHETIRERKPVSSVS